MGIILTDTQIAALLAEEKRLGEDWESRMHLKKGRKGYLIRDLSVRGEGGNDFRLFLRQNAINPLDFSVVLGVVPPKSADVFRLRRHNGKSHAHGNSIEKQRFYDFHIHMATERYQDLDKDEETYAEVTKRYSTFDGALKCMLKDANFKYPGDNQLDLFDAG